MPTDRPRKKAKPTSKVKRTSQDKSSGAPLAKLSAQMSAPALARVRFERLNENPSDEELNAATLVQIGYGVARFSTERIGVELTVSSNENPAVSFEVAYRATFEVQGGTQDTDYVSELQAVTAYVASATLYPFIRETVTSLAHRAGLSKFTLPLVNFHELVKPKELDIPPVAPAQAQLERRSKSK